MTRQLQVALLLATVFLPMRVATAQPPAMIVVETTAPGVALDGLCSLTEALENASAGAAPHVDCEPGGATTTVELAPAATYELPFAHNGTDDGTGLPVIVRPITINGHGATIARSSTPGTPPFRILMVESSPFLVETLHGS